MDLFQSLHLWLKSRYPGLRPPVIVPGEDPVHRMPKGPGIFVVACRGAVGEERIIDAGVVDDLRKDVAGHPHMVEWDRLRRRDRGKLTYFVIPSVDSAEKDSAVAEDIRARFGLS